MQLAGSRSGRRRSPDVYGAARQRRAMLRKAAAEVAQLLPHELRRREEGLEFSDLRGGAAGVRSGGPRRPLVREALCQQALQARLSRQCEAEESLVLNTHIRQGSEIWCAG